LALKRGFIKAVSKTVGIKPYMGKSFINKFWNDFRKEKRTNFKQKLWAYKRGFTSSKLIDYGLNDENYKKFLSDLDYYRLFPLNNVYVKWINDKLTTKYILNKFNEHQPQYFFHVNKGRVIAAIDAPDSEKITTESVVELLKEEGKLAFKPEAGSLGVGFYKVEYNKEFFFVNGQIVDEEGLLELINSLDQYLVTEFILAHNDIDKIYPGIANSIRIMVIKDGDKPAETANAFIRFGTDETKGVDNASAGGLFSIVDIDKGAFKTGYRFVDGELTSYDTHPDTNVPIEGILPHWESIVDKVLEIADYLGQLSWLGFDVVITDDGFKILEINSHQDISWYQYFYPLLEGNPASDFLNKKLFKN